MARARACELLVHPYRFRNEPSNLTVQDRGNPVGEYGRFYAAGVDGVFSDPSDTAYAARAVFRLSDAPWAASGARAW